MSRFTIERTDVELESSFAPRLWALIHDVPVLYEALLDKLDGAGLSTADLRPDPGDGSVGSAGLGFWLFGGKTNVRLGLDSVRLRSLASSDVAAPMEGVLAALRQVEPDVRFRAHTFEYACHGVVEGVRSADFVRQFVPAVPAIEGFGEYLGAGAAFYYRCGLPRDQLDTDVGRIANPSGWSLCAGLRGGRRDGRDRAPGPDTRRGAGPGSAGIPELGDRVTRR